MSDTKTALIIIVGIFGFAGAFYGLQYAGSLTQRVNSAFEEFQEERAEKKRVKALQEGVLKTERIAAGQSAEERRNGFVATIWRMSSEDSSEVFELTFNHDGEPMIRSSSVLNGGHEAQCTINSAEILSSFNLTRMKLTCATDVADPLRAAVDLGHGGLPRAALFKVLGGTILPVKVALEKGHVVLTQQRVPETEGACEIEIISDLQQAKEMGYNRIIFGDRVSPTETVDEGEAIIKAGTSTYRIPHEEMITGEGTSRLVQSVTDDHAVDFANFSYRSDLDSLTVIYDGPDVEPFRYSNFDLGACVNVSGALLAEPLEYEMARRKRTDGDYETSRTIRMGGQTCPIFLDIDNQSSHSAKLSIRPVISRNSSYFLGFTGSSDYSLDGSLVAPAGIMTRLYFNPSGAWFNNAIEIDKDEEWSRRLLLDGETLAMASVDGEWSIHSIYNGHIRDCLANSEPLFISGTISRGGRLSVEGIR